MFKRSKKLKRFTEEALDLAFLEDEIEAMTKEYLLLGREIQNRVIPTTAYPHYWRMIHRKMETLNKDLKEKSYYVAEDGIHLKENYDIEKERRAYLRYILIRLLAPAAKLDSPFEHFMERYYTQAAYTEKERAELDALILRFEEIFTSKEVPKRADFLHFPSELKVYLAYLRAYYHPLRNILSEIWHGTLKAGEEILLNDLSEEMFFFLLSGLMTQELNNKHAAWELYVILYFHGYNRGTFSPKEEK